MHGHHSFSTTLVGKHMGEAPLGPASAVFSYPRCWRCSSGHWFVSPGPFARTAENPEPACAYDYEQTAGLPRWRVRKLEVNPAAMERWRWRQMRAGKP